MSYVLITGASSGIGYELALLFAKNGYNLILIARQKNKLLHVAGELKKNCGIEALILSIDLSHPDSATEIWRQVHEKSIPVRYLINNAGFYVKGSFSNTSWEEEQSLIQLQCLNYTRLIKLFLPAMIKQGKGGILNIGSTGSFVPGPYNAVYCAAKSFVLSLSEALAEEISDSEVTISALCPGGTDTAFQDMSKVRKSIFFPTMEASRVARIGYNGLMKGKRVIIPGLRNKIQVFLTRFLPRNLVTKSAGSVVNR